MTPVEVSLCAQASTSASGSATGAGASPGSASTTIGSARKGAAGGRLGELLRELAVGQVQGALADQPGRGGLPERGRAAVAERDLVAVGEAEQLAEAGADAPDQVPHRRLAMRGAHQSRTARRAWPAPRGGPSRGRSRSARRRASARLGSGLCCSWSLVSPARCHRADGRQVIDRRGWTPAGTEGRLAALRWQSRPTARGESMYPISYEADFNPTPNRWTTFFRLILAIPWFIVATFWLILFALHPPLRLGRRGHPRPLPAVAVQLQLRRRPLLDPLPRPGSTCRPTSGRRSASATTRATRSGSTSRRRRSARAGSRPSSASSSSCRWPGRSPTRVNYIHLLAAVVAWLTIVFRGYLPEGINNVLTFVNSFYARVFGYLRAPHRRLPADRPRAGQAGGRHSPACRSAAASPTTRAGRVGLRA